MASKSVNAPRHVRFHDVEDLHMYNISWEATAKILSGRISDDGTVSFIYRAILSDECGDKMEALASGRNAVRVNNELIIGEVYLFIGLGFHPAEALTDPLLHTNYYISLHSRTQILLAGPTVSIPVLPDRYMAFSDVANLINMQLTDVSTAEGALKSTEDSHIEFQPDTILPYYELASWRDTLQPAYHQSILRRVRAYVRHRVKRGLYDNLHIWRFKSSRRGLMHTNMAVGAL